MDARKIEIEGINKLVEEGIPADYMLLLQTDEGLETDLLVRQYIKEALTKGEICIAVLSESSPDDFKKLMSAIGINAETHEKNGTL
ncbi:MAG: ATPase domain-containing protein, partial [Thermoplasmata archaeon]